MVGVIEAAREFRAEIARYWPEGEQAVARGASKVAPPGLAAYCSLVANSHFSIPWTVESLELFAEGEMDGGQLGYRWFCESDGQAGEALSNWPENWIVLGQFGGDPVIFDSETAEVMLAEHGMGSWAPEAIAADLAEFLQLLTTWIRVAIGDYQQEFRDDDFELLPAFRLSLEKELFFLSKKHRDNFLATLG